MIPKHKPERLEPGSLSPPRQPLTLTPTTKRSDRLRAALNYADRGWHVFPCEPGGKKPLTKRGHLEASTDPRRITAWWSRWPDANIGIPTGKRTGILAVDVDHPAGLEALKAEHGKLPATRTHTTGSGGMHYLFTYPAGVEIRNSAGKLAEHIDVRGEGGYIVAPPSTTTRPYEVLDDPPLAETPASLLELLVEPRERRSGRARTRAPVSLENAGEPIPVGIRNNTLTRIAGRLHDGTRDQAGLEAELLSINERRCTEPLEVSEVLSIARWIFGREPCRPERKQDPEIAEILERASQYWYDRLLRRGGQSKRRDVFRALIGFGARHGEVVRVRIAGKERRAVRFSASLRQVAPEAGTTPTSVSRNTKRLRELGAIRKDDAERHEEDGGTFLIIEPAHYRYTSINASAHGAKRSVDEGCNTTARPPRPDELQTPAPRWGDHVGNARAGTLYALEAFGPQSREELAERVGIKRARDIERRHLEPLAEQGLVENIGGMWALSGAYEERTGELRRAPYGTIRRVRRRRRTSEGRRVTEVVEVGSVASVEERDRADRERFEIETRAFRERRRRPAERLVAVAEGGPQHEIREISGELRELERVAEDSPVVDTELLDALALYLERNPHRRRERPSWLAVALWAEELVHSKPPPSDIEAALEWLGEGAA